MSAWTRWVNPVGLFTAVVGALLLVAPRAEAACNLTDPTWANRDDDGDGICNGADNCPFEANPLQEVAAAGGGSACQPQPITVPWIPANPNAPHVIYPGATTTLKGIARYVGSGAGYQYQWDYGDGSGSTAFTNISDPYNLGVSHTYQGTAGQLFFATLYLKNVASGVTASAQYRLQLVTSSDPMNDPNQMDVRTAMAIDNGLWYLHTTASRSAFADNAPGYRQDYAVWGDVVSTCGVVDAYDLHGSKPLQNYDVDPYVEDSRRGLAFMLNNAATPGISAGQGPSGTYDPRVNGHDYGVTFSGGNDTYTDGICAVSFASAAAPGRVALNGNGNIFNQRYQTIAQDTVDWFAYGQTDCASCGARGGWLYSANSQGADGSTNQWPMLAMAAAEDTMGATIPAFVRAEVPYFLAYSHNASTGGWGYQFGGQYDNEVKTAAGLLSHYFRGDATGNGLSEVNQGLGFMYAHWGLGNNSWQDYLYDSSYAMFGVMKAMRKPQPNILRITNYGATASFDWYYGPTPSGPGLAPHLVGNQFADGHWADGTNPNGATFGNPAGAFGIPAGLSVPLTTAWRSIILNKGVTTIPPTAALCNCSATWSRNAPTTFDGSCSTDNDPTRFITKYDWDYNFNGSTFNQSLDSHGFGITGMQVTKADGFPYTEDYLGNPLPGAKITVALRVTDNNPGSLGGPNTSIATCAIHVKPPPHCPQPVIGGPYLGAVNVPVNFDASQSVDIDGSPMEFAWDFHNHSVFPSPTSTADRNGATTQWTFALPGTYPIAMQVTDHPALNPDPTLFPGAAPPDCKVVAYTTVEIGAHAPIAKAGGPYSVVVGGNSIQLDASGSTDPDGLALTYAWDLTGSGSFSDSTAINPTFSVGAAVPSGTSYTVCVKVSNTARSATSCTSVNVIKQLVAPVCQIIAPTVVASCTGGTMPVQIDASRSYDGNDNNDPLLFSWTSNCGGAATFSSTTASITTLSFSSAQLGCTKSCTATVAVTDKLHPTDSGGNPLVSNCPVTISILDNLAPVFSAKPANTTIECDPNATANVNAWLSSSAAGDACAPSGTNVSIGTDFSAGAGCGGVGVGQSKTVTWSGTGVCSGQAVGQTSATVTVVDTTPPVLTLPSSITLEANLAAPNGRVYTYAPTALDFVNGNRTVTCTPASGFTFPIAQTRSTTTLVSCSASDLSGNSSSGSFNVTIQDTTPPVLALPAPIVVEATKPQGADVPFTTTAADIVDVTDPVTCTRGGAGVTSGATFPINATTTGVTTVNCTTTDKHGNTSTGSFNVSIKDTTPPVLTVPAAFTVEATSAAGATVTFASSAADLVDVTAPVTCTPASGSVFPIGATAVNCTSTDQHANTGSKSFFVTVRDTTGPTLSGAALTTPITLEATSASGATLASYGLTAADTVDGALAVTCAKPSGSVFALGSTQVACSATDSRGNKTSATVTVDVVDTTGPAMSCPASISVVANGPAGAENWGTVNDPTSKSLATFLAAATATDLVDAIPTVINNAPALLPVGQATTVTFTGKDVRLNATTCTSSVTVTAEVEPQPVLTCPSSATLSVGAGVKIDWTAAFRRPVAVEMIRLSGNDPGTASPLAVFESGDRQAQLTSSATATGSFAVRLRATDEFSGTTIECNRFISLLGPGVASGSKVAPQQGVRLAP